MLFISRSLLRKDYCMMIARKTLDLGRIGVRNSPGPGFFGQSLAQAWFPYQEGLLHDDCAKTLDLGRIGARNAPDPVFFRPKPRQAPFSSQGRLLHDVWAENLGSGRYRRSKRPRSRVLRPKALFKLGSLLREDYCMMIAQKPWIWAVSALETAQIQGFSAQAFGPSLAPFSGRTTA